MRLRGKMHHGVRLGNQIAHQLSIAHVAHHKLNAVPRQSGDVSRVAGIRKRVKNRHAHARMLAHHVAHKGGPHKPEPSGNKNVVQRKTARHGKTSQPAAIKSLRWSVKTTGRTEKNAAQIAKANRKHKTPFYKPSYSIRRHDSITIKEMLATRTQA